MKNVRKEFIMVDKLLETDKLSSIQWQLNINKLPEMSNLSSVQEQMPISIDFCDLDLSLKTYLTSNYIIFLSLRFNYQVRFKFMYYLLLFDRWILSKEFIDLDIDINNNQR